MSECQAKTKIGRVCSAPALLGGLYCYQHEPTRASERAAARKLGGMRRGSHAGDTSSLPHQVRKLEDVLSLLDYTRDELLALDNGIPRARALIALAGEYVHALEMSEIEQRLQALEERVNVKKR